MTGQKIHAPLGGRRARYAPRLDALTRAALEDLEAWFTEHPEAYVAVSGGKDSTVCLALAKQVNPDVKAVFFDSGLEFPQTLKYLERLRHEWSLDLVTYHASPPALDVLEASGQWEQGVPKISRNLLHEACIDAPLAQAQQDLGRASVYGLRADESSARLALLSKHRGRVTKRDRQGRLEQSYLAPIWRWSHEEVHAYLGRHDLPVNPLYRELMRLGVPERRARVGLLVDGWALDQGRWALARIVAPDLCRVVEARLPALAEFR